MTDLFDIDPAPRPDSARDAAERAQLMEAWHTPSGWRRISAVNNSIVGIWYLSASFAFFVFAGCLASPPFWSSKPRPSGPGTRRPRISVCG